MKDKKEKNSSCPSRLGRVGGQAVLEGVMMKAGDRTVTTCRKEDGTIVVSDNSFKSIRQKHKLLDLPIIRGVVNFVEMMILSFKTLGASADAMGIEDEEKPSKFEKWLSEKLGVGLTDVIMVISLILGLGLSVLLFVFLPIWITAGIDFLIKLCGGGGIPAWVSAVLEGLIKVFIFVGYLALVSLMPDIKRTFMYHGAEHKSIACFEAGDELTPENAMKHKRFHPRCGTSFMFFMIILGIFAGLIIKTLIVGLPTWAYTLIRLAILPILMGIGYEIIRLAGKYPNFLTRAISAPGLWVQRITTKEPTEDMLEVAIISLKCALRDDFPEFEKFFEEKPWEPVVKDECAEGDADGEAEEDNAIAEDGVEDPAQDTEATAEGVEALAEETGLTAESTESSDIDTESSSEDTESEGTEGDEA